MLKIDVMKDGGGRFYKTLHYPFNPLFKIDPVQVVAWVAEQLPSIRGKKDIKLIFYGYGKEKGNKEKRNDGCNKKCRMD